MLPRSDVHFQSTCLPAIAPPSLPGSSRHVTQRQSSSPSLTTPCVVGSYPRHSDYTPEHPKTCVLWFSKMEPISRISSLLEKGEPPTLPVAFGRQD